MAGSAFLEMQFYAPGFSPFIKKISCDLKHWCASLHINSLEVTEGHLNPNCAETTNFAFIQRNGIPTGPLGFASLTGASFTPNDQTLLMNQGDRLLITIVDVAGDVSGGVMTRIDDLTTGQSGFMIASAANGYQSANPKTCAPVLTFRRSVALRVEVHMRKATLLPMFLLISVLTLWGQSPVVRWREVVGIIQPGSVVGSGTGAVPGGLLPWVTTGGVARVNLDTGEIQFVVKGLVLAGGNPIGTRGDISAVRGTLVCDTDGSAGGGNSVLVQSAAVPLSLDGDAHFSGSVGTLPAVCSSEPDLAFLIRIAEVNGVAVNGPWIAFGAVRED